MLLRNRKREFVAWPARGFRLLQYHYTVAHAEIGLPAMAIGLPGLPLLRLDDHRMRVVDVALDSARCLLGILAIDSLPWWTVSKIFCMQLLVK